MDDLRLDTLAGHVVDWHNRHPLARRITLAHVHSVGYVALPFAADKPQAATAGGAAHVDVAGASQADGGDGASLRERAMARAQQQAAGQSPDLPAPAPPPVPDAATAQVPAPAAQPLFSENFIPPLRPKAVAAFAWQHGAASARPGKDGPVRQVLIDGAVSPALVQQRWLLTAQIDVGGARTRVLVGSGLTPAVLGRRLLRTRQLALGLGLLLALAAALGWMRMGVTPPESMAPTATPGPVGSEAAASAALAPVATEPAASTVPVALPALATARTETTPAPVPASAPVATPAPLAASAPVDVEPTLGRVQLPSLGPIIEERRQALAAARQASAAVAAAAPASAARPTPRLDEPAPATRAKPPAAAVATPTPPVLAPPARGPAFAVSTRLLRTRTEGELTADAMRELLSGPHAPGLRVEALRVGDDWRVVAWPYSGREGAEKARAMLAARGMRVQVIDF